MIIGDTDCRAGSVRAQAASSLIMKGNETVSSTSGGLGAPAVAASPRAIRSIAARTRSRISVLKVRTLSPSSARSGTMFAAVPACMEPMVRTAVSPAGISREMIVCRRSTAAAAITIGSTEASGREPCAPWPA